MTRKDLVDRLYELEEGTLSRARIAGLVDRMFEQLADGIVEEGRVSVPSFGTFTVHVRSARVGRNPKTGEPIQLAESSTVRFKPSESLRERLR
ncbi:MAG: HU family DNA-binding protein [Myxococcota bacterium]